MKRYLTKYELRWALIFIMISLLWTAFEYEMGWHDEHIERHRYSTFLFLIPATLVYILFILNKKSHRFKKRFKFKHAFKSGLGLTFLIVLLAIPAQIIIHNWVTPDFVSNAQKYVVEAGEMTVREASEVLSVTKFVFFFPILYLFFGVCMSALIGFFFGKK